MDLRERGVHDTRGDRRYAVGELHVEEHSLGDTRRVAEPEALGDTAEARIELVGVDGCAVIAADGDDDGRRSPSPPVGLLGLELTLVFRDRHDRGERSHRHGDPDQAEQDAQLVHADLRPGVGESAEEAGHATNSGGADGTEAARVEASKARLRSTVSRRPASSR